MNLIAAVDKNWAIGYKNELLVRIPEDQKWFRETTTGKAVIMGRKTLESFPNKRPLKNRTNIVITKDMNYKVDGAIVVHSIEEAVEAAKDFADEDIYVIGGASIYKQMLPLCDVAHITKIDYAYDADSYFPNLEEEGFVITESSDERTYFDLIYEFVKYERKNN
ncbi:dihydrofolate reductase [Eshraghiella crossota]